MSYCPKCGNKVDETMTFCPRCGAPLKGQAPYQAPPQTYRKRDEKSEKNEKQEKQEPEKQEKGEHGFVGWLIGGLILIVIGFFSLLRINEILPAGTGWAIALLIIGVIIIVGAILLTSRAKRHYPRPH